MNNTIKNFFYIYFFDKRMRVVYSELEDGTYVKTYMKNEEVHIDIIPPSEYAAALAYNNYLIMKTIPRNPNV
jgi:tRNA isopentenyl-2-thiomethyl-A-37 hydroxylase MiaE